ncbi:CopG family antitoxin [Archangium sp.]|uniref:CopG family antitoxin n=1 Tax=Archangium sp. TaxID=1872627 RepID=UPI00286CBBC4|nr:CopG family antitoxin [Archangium sp.]
MKNRQSKPVAEQRVRTPHEQLAREAASWDERRLTPAGFTDAPEAIPNASQSVAISIRMPNQLLELLKKFAKHEGIGYQVLIKRWLDDRLRAELDTIRKQKASRSSEHAHKTSIGERKT